PFTATRPPPTPTLFPYTTLFRSADPGCDSGEQPNGDVADSTTNLISHEHNETITDPLGTGWYDRLGNEDGDKCAWNFGSALGSRDRKSTRLNSSHDQISYAVFCL